MSVNMIAASLRSLWDNISLQLENRMIKPLWGRSTYNDGVVRSGRALSVYVGAPTYERMKGRSGPGGI